MSNERFIAICNIYFYLDNKNVLIIISLLINS